MEESDIKSAANAAPVEMSRSERMLRDEVHNILVLLEHYKLQLTRVLPKVLLVIRKAQQRGNKKKLEET